MNNGNRREIAIIAWYLLCIASSLYAKLNPLCLLNFDWLSMQLFIEHDDLFILRPCWYGLELIVTWAMRLLKGGASTIGRVTACIRDGFSNFISVYKPCIRSDASAGSIQHDCDLEKTITVTICNFCFTYILLPVRYSHTVSPKSPANLCRD